MQTQPLTREDVIQVVGDLDDTVIADVISTGASQTELELAVERLRDESALSRADLDPHVVALCDVLGPVLRSDDDDVEFLGTD